MICVRYGRGWGPSLAACQAALLLRAAGWEQTNWIPSTTGWTRQLFLLPLASLLHPLCPPVILIYPPLPSPQTRSDRSWEDSARDRLCRRLLKAKSSAFALYPASSQYTRQMDTERRDKPIKKASCIWTAPPRDFSSSTCLGMVRLFNTF